MTKYVLNPVRDYFEEAQAIIRGDSILLCERAHLLELNRIIEELSIELGYRKETMSGGIKNKWGKLWSCYKNEKSK